MARYPLNEPVRYTDGRVAAGVPVKVVARGTNTEATVYLAETGAAAHSWPTITDAVGRLNGWYGLYDQSGLPRRLDYVVLNPDGTEAARQAIEPRTAAVVDAVAGTFTSPWKNLELGYKGLTYWRTCDGLVVVHGILQTSSATAAFAKIGPIPSGYEPAAAEQLSFLSLFTSLSVPGAGYCYVTHDGTAWGLYFANNTTGNVNDYIAINAAWRRS